MTFISLTFLIFFAVVFLINPYLSHRKQNLFLLGGSYLFYAWWDWRFLGLLFASSVIDFHCGHKINTLKARDSENFRKRRAYLLLSVVVNLGILGAFKYFDFFVQNLNRILPLSLPMLYLVLPLGISFYTFQTLSYTIDIYRGRCKPTKRFTDYLLYVSFFPQLVAGPIERGGDFLPQVTNPRKLSWEQISSGAQLASWGFFKKLVFADNLAPIVRVLLFQEVTTGSQVLIAIYAYSLQIYCDFSAYTDIARGCARMLGFSLCENFRFPFLATSPRDFWKRWHVSLSTWLRDYLYIELGGSRKGRLRTYTNLMLTMLLGGIWHGAAWHFAIWGIYHGCLLSISRVFADFHRLPTLIRQFLTFHLVGLGWLFFRAETNYDYLKWFELLFQVTKWDYAFLASAMSLQVLIALFTVLWFQSQQEISGEAEIWNKWGHWGRIFFYLGIIYGIILLGAPRASTFVYFRF